MLRAANGSLPPFLAVLLLSVDLRPAHPLLKKLGSESGLVMIADAVELIDSLFSALADQRRSGAQCVA